MAAIAIKYTVPINIDTDIEFKRIDLSFLSIITKQTLKLYNRSIDGFIDPFIPFSSLWLKKLMGRLYIDSIRKLIDLGIIEVFTSNQGKQSYLNIPLSDPRNYCGRDKFCKMYRLTDQYCEQLAKGLVKFISKKITISNRNKIFVETAILDCEETIKIAEAIKRIKFKDLNELDEESILLAQAMQSGITNAKRSKNTGRCTHIVLRNREFREKMTVDDEELNQLDSSALHPKILISHIKDPEERKRYKEILDQDIYTYFQNIITEKENFEKRRKTRYPITREAIKKQVQIAFSNKRKGCIAQDIVAFYQDNFPSIYKFLEDQWKSKTTVQCVLQRVEAQIFIGAFKAASFWALPLHDCLMVKRSDFDKAKNLINEFALREIGIDIV